MVSSEKGDGLTVSGLAETCAVGLGTIRYYQKIGLITRPEKPKHGGFRRYGQKDVERLQLIRNAQALGFTLKEIGELLRHGEKNECDSLRRIFTSRIATIKDRIHELEVDLKRLVSLNSLCDKECSENRDSDCRLVQSFVRSSMELVERIPFGAKHELT